MGEAFPTYCVNVDETLNWGFMTMMVYADGAGEEKIGTQHRWYYVPRAGSDVIPTLRTLTFASSRISSTDTLLLRPATFMDSHSCSMMGIRPRRGILGWEVSPIDPRVVKRISGMMGPEPEFAGLTIRGHDSGSQTAESARADTAMDTSQGSVAPKTPGDKRETVKKSVLERIRWFPGYDLAQEHSDPSGHYGLIEAFTESAYVCELAPFFQKQAPMFGEGNSLSLARPSKMTTIATGPQAEWERWCNQYRDAFFSVLGSSGFRDKRGAPWDEDCTSEVVRQGVWNHTDGIVAVSIHGLRAVTSMPPAIAHSAAPPTVGPRNPGAKQRFVVLHDGAITFRSAKNKYHDGEFSKHMTSAIEFFRFGDVSVRVQKCDDNAALRDMLVIAEKIKHEGGIPVWETRILIIWRGSDLHKLDDSWNNFTGPIDQQDVSRITLADIPEVERLNQVFGSVSVCGPMSPVIGCLPSAPTHLAEGFRSAFRSIWDKCRLANFLAIPYDALIEGIPHVKGYYPMLDGKTVGTLCSKICGMFMIDGSSGTVSAIRNETGN